MSNLTQLTLTFNPIGLRGAEAIAGSENFRNLTLIDLYETGLGNAGARILAESTTLRNLETLVLIHNDIGNEVQALFKDNKNFPKIKDVYFFTAKAEV